MTGARDVLETMAFEATVVLFAATSRSLSNADAGRVREAGNRLRAAGALATARIFTTRESRSAAPRVRENFYLTPEWRAVRYRALILYGNTCQCCGRGKEDGIVLHVDHIKPRSRYPDLALDVTNLQVLCDDCNIGKGARDETDWRDGR